MNLSFWERSEIKKKNQIVIIGAGIVGLCTAIEIKRKEPDVAVLILERGRLPSGASTKNAGFACFGSVTEILGDLGIMSEPEVINIISKRFAGLARLKSLINTEKIDYFQCGGYEVFDKAEDFPEQTLIEKANILMHKAIGKEDVFQVMDQNFGFNLNTKLIFNSLEGQLNPAKLIFGLTQLAYKHNIRILYNTEVKIVGEDCVTCPNLGQIPFKKLAVCTNGFAKSLIPILDVVPARNQVLITNPVHNMKLKGTFHYDQGYVYFRNVGNRILLGGGRNMDFEHERTTDFGTTDNIKNYLKDFLFNKLFPNEKIKIEGWWSGIMGVGSSKKTIVSKINENQFVGVRMGGMGIAIGSIIGEELAQKIVA